MIPKLCTVFQVQSPKAKCWWNLCWWNSVAPRATAMYYQRYKSVDKKKAKQQQTRKCNVRRHMQTWPNNNKSSRRYENRWRHQEKRWKSDKYSHQKILINRQAKIQRKLMINRDFLKNNRRVADNSFKEGTRGRNVATWEVVAERI